MPYTTVTAAGQTFNAYTDGAHHWIDAGQWLRDTITATATTLIPEAQASLAANQLPARTTIDAAMRLQREITAHARNERFRMAGATVDSDVDDLPSLVAAIDLLIERLPDMVRDCVRPDNW